jgi:hypothetical protein
MAILTTFPSHLLTAPRSLMLPEVIIWEDFLKIIFLILACIQCLLNLDLLKQKKSEEFISIIRKMTTHAWKVQRYNLCYEMHDNICCHRMELKSKNKFYCKRYIHIYSHALKFHYKVDIYLMKSIPIDKIITTFSTIWVEDERILLYSKIYPFKRIFGLFPIILTGPTHLIIPLSRNYSMKSQIMHHLNLHLPPLV